MLTDSMVENLKQPTKLHRFTTTKNNLRKLKEKTYQHTKLPPYRPKMTSKRKLHVLPDSPSIEKHLQINL